MCSSDLEYKFMSKWNSYIGLAATDSIPVSMPNIVVVDDKEIRMKAKVDVVREIDTRDEKGNIHRKFSVLHDKVKRIPTNLFDGAGIVTVKMSDGELRETQTANYFSNLYPIDCAVPSVDA